MKKSNVKSEIIEEAIVPRLEICGNTRCIVDGLKSIIKYTPEEIKLNLGKHCVTFSGDGLYIESFSYSGAIIEGTIITIGFDNND